LKHPRTHDKPPHDCWPHRWNPYYQRDGRTHILDKAVFNKLLGDYPDGYIDPVLFMTGCLDAPEDIPLGATASILTIGGFYREEYLTLGREWESWERHQQAGAEMAVMLKQILDEADAS
jgi:hypothetical protein